MLNSILLLTATAMSTSPQYASPKIVNAALLKNGYAIVTREIKIPASGSVLVDDLPKSTLGTVWFASEPGTELRKVYSSQDARTKPADLGSTGAFLAANKGKTVQLTLSDKSAITGKVVSATDSLVLIDQGDQVIGVSPSTVLTVSGTGLVSEGKVNLPVTTVLHLELSKAEAGTVYMIDLEPGLSWNSAYRLELNNDHTMALTGRAEIINGVGNLENAAVSLISGSPTASHLGTMDPLVLVTNGTVYQPAAHEEGYASDGFGGGGLGGARYMAKGAMVQNAMIAAPDSAISLEDLFAYKLNSVTLGANQTGYYGLIKTKLSYKDVYTWNVSPYGDQPSPEPAGTYQMPQDYVWHSITFKNDSGDVLSDGPIEIDRDGLLLCQRDIAYTAKKADVTIPISVTRDVNLVQTVQEVSRVKRAASYAGNRTADLVTLKATMTISNLHDSPLSVIVSRPFSGSVVDAGGASVFMDGSGASGINGHGIAKWTVDVKPQETKTLTFTYKAYSQAY